MNIIKIRIPRRGKWLKVEARQIDPLHHWFEILHEGRQIAILKKENGRWFTSNQDALISEEVADLGKAIDAAWPYY